MKQALYIFLLFPILFVFSEFFRTDLTNFKTINLSFFLVYYLISFFGIFLFLNISSLPVYKKLSISVNSYFKILIIFSFSLFFFFILKNLGSFNLIDVVIFSEKYRNSYYKGSGIYTFLVLSFFPIVIAFFMLKSKEKDNWLIFGTILCLCATFILGLRIYLFPIIIVLFIKYFSKKRNIISISFFVICIFLVLISFKYFLGGRVFTESSSLLDIIILTLSRTNYSALLHSGNINLLFEFIESTLLSFFIDKDLHDFKDYFHNVNFTNLSYYYPGINKTTGIAIPITVVLYNSLGFLSIIPFFALLMGIVLSYKKMLKTESLFLSYISFVFFISFLGILIEDVFFVSKIIINICFYPLIKIIHDKK
jgi:hypothetical protein